MTLVVDASVVVAALVDAGPVGTWAESTLASRPLAAPHLMACRTRRRGDGVVHRTRKDLRVTKPCGDDVAPVSPPGIRERRPELTRGAT